MFDQQFEFFNAPAMMQNTDQFDKLLNAELDARCQRRADNFRHVIDIDLARMHLYKAIEHIYKREMLEIVDQEK